MIYLDYAANSIVDPEVLKVFNDATIKYFANPNSVHKLGLEAERAIQESTNNIAKKLNILPDEIIYTSGATEANNLAIKGIANRYKNKGKHIIIGSLEHNSIVASCTELQNLGFEIDLIPVRKDGLLDLDVLKNLIRDDTILVSVCAVDSEIGIIQPIDEIGEFLSNYENIIFHTDLSQALGKIKIDFKNIDLATIAPHKFGGLNGSGILVKKKEIGIMPLIHGGKSTTIYRSGTPVTANIVAMDKAIEIAILNIEERYNYVLNINKKIQEFLSRYKNITINSTKNSIPYTINFSIKGIKSVKFVSRLEEHEVYISSKTSCCPVQTPSKLVYALTGSKQLAVSSARISISHLTTEDEIQEFFKIFDKVYKELENE